jgi:hypothetical protein
MKIDTSKNKKIAIIKLCSTDYTIDFGMEAYW